MALSRLIGPRLSRPPTPPSAAVPSQHLEFVGGLHRLYGPNPVHNSDLTLLPDKFIANI